jgi:hypothetical protein
METQKLKLQHLKIVAKSNQIAGFLKLIQSGFRMRAKTGLSIKELLCNHLGISDEYLDNRIQTLFIDGKPVDNENTARVYDGARIALSVAMPGLVGATFRKRGQYASFRGTISYTEPKNPGKKGEGDITLVFFNMVTTELGPAFLQKGIIIDGKRLQDFLEHHVEYMKDGCNSIHLNGAEIDVSRLAELNWEDQEVSVQITSEKEL